MYRALGFKEVPPYRHNPVPGTRYMALSLTGNKHSRPKPKHTAR
jgi:hypothetical protein